jgi:O-antigen ligase
MNNLRFLDHFSGRWFGLNKLALLAVSALVTGCAIVVGTLVGQEHWAFLAALAGLIVACLWPIEIALGFYAFLLPFNSVSVLGGGTSGTTLNWVVGAITAIALLASGIVRKRLKFPPRAALIWLVFLLWSMLTILWSVQPQEAIKQLPTSIALVGLYILAVSWQITEKQFSFVTLMAVAGGWLASCYVIYLFETGVTYRVTSRASLFLGGRETNPDTLATEFIIPLALALVCLLMARGWFGKITSLIAATTIGYAVLLCMSRAALLAIVVMMAVFAFRLGKNRRLLLVASLLALSLVAVPSAFFTRLGEAVQTGGAGRFDIWIAGLTIWKRFWATGSGMATFPVIYNQYAGNAPVFRGFGRGSHNTLLQVGVELGILGVVLMVMALVAHFGSVRRLRARLHSVPIPVVGLESACWGMLTFALSGDILWSKAFWLSWMLLLMAVKSSEKVLGGTNGGIARPRQHGRRSDNPAVEIPLLTRSS